jgi:16S rRNA C967 or C1407 C5-methylase (RsmB/RsmF family)/NOL1/NOP2/fmu family ribosome biogenesis protein
MKAEMRNASNIDWPRVLGPLADKGFDVRELSVLERATGEHSRRAIRLANHQEPANLPFEVERVPWYQSGYFLTSSKVRPGSFLQYAAGDYYIQDAGSMLALALSEIQPGQLVCDTCASPGGKSTGALELLQGTGGLVSNEVIASRLPILGLTLCRSGYSNFIVTNRDVEVLGTHLPESFDCVIVDAPCTGQSMVVRGKQSMAAYSQRQIEHSTARQLRILRAAAALVKPNGRLVYSTCTFSFAENEGIVSQLIAEQPTWTPKRFPALAQWESAGFPGCYRLWPHRDDCAGGFAAALIRSESTTSGELQASMAKSTNHWTQLERLPEDADWFEMRGTNDARLFQLGQQIHLFPSFCDATWLELAASGQPIAREHAGRTEPLYGSSVVADARFSASRLVELNDDEARRFVAGESIRQLALAEHSATSGWCAATWRGRKLAWGKLAGGVLKNHFPKALRAQNLTSN